MENQEQTNNSKEEDSKECCSGGACETGKKANCFTGNPLAKIIFIALLITPFFLHQSLRISYLS